MEWTDENFTKAVQESTTIIQVLKKLGQNTNEGFYNSKFHNDVERLGLDISKFKKSNKKTNLEIILVENSPWRGNTSTLKSKLLTNNILQKVCAECNLEPVWNNKPLVLQLDHINGKSNDNRIENLRILCPNCHTQTHTYSGKNKHKKSKNICHQCGNEHPTNSKFCKICIKNYSTKIKWPTNQELIKMLELSNYRQLGIKLGVSDNAIRKKLKKTLTPL